MKIEKKMIVPIVIGVVLLIAVVAGVAMKMKSSKTAEAPTTQKKKKTENFNTIAVAERPFLELVPTDGGKNIIISVTSMKKPAKTVEYELEYQAGELLQGAFGSLDLATLPVTKEILFGSCSAGGACTYHTDIKGGTLVMRFAGGDQDYALKSDWKYVDNAAKESSFASRDAKFQLESKDLAKARYMTILNSPGAPEGLTGTAISEIYSLRGTTALTGKAKVTIRMTEEAAGAKIMGYDGKAWKTLTTTVSGKEATADDAIYQVYVAVKL